jgi:hypothetical protein
MGAMNELLSGFSEQQLVTDVVAVLTAIFALDVWRRVARAFQVLGDGATTVRRRFAASLVAWVVGALAFTLVPPLRNWADAQAWFQPLVVLAGIGAVTAPIAIAGFRRAFDSLPIDELLGLFYWRAIFGLALLAFYTGAVLPARFALQPAVGDIVVTCVMVLLLAAAQRSGRVPRRPLLVWNTLGLLDLVNVLFLVGTVLLPWAAEQGTELGNYTLRGFVVPLFIGLHLQIYGRWWRERPAARTPLHTQGEVA